MHCEQLDRPVTEANFPEGQSVQAAWPESSLNLPTAQAVQVLLLISLNVPARQASQAATPAVLKEPAAQCLHEN
jgi:hypothetical protein